jgi:transposase
LIAHHCYEDKPEERGFYTEFKLKLFGHTGRFIPAQHVTPFVRGNKNDHNDALAIVEASQRPNIRFVPR